MANRPLILLLEDDHAIADTMKMVLDDEGYNVQIARDCPGAERFMSSAQPDLALVDYQLDCATAEPFINLMQERYKAVPLMLLTARSNPEALAAALRIGHLIKKPFEVDDLIGMIQSVIAK